MDCSSITDFQQSTAIRIAKKFRNLHIGLGDVGWTNSNVLLLRIIRRANSKYCSYCFISEERLESQTSVVILPGRGWKVQGERGPEGH